MVDALREPKEIVAAGTSAALILIVHVPLLLVSFVDVAVSVTV